MIFYIIIYNTIKLSSSSSFTQWMYKQSYLPLAGLAVCPVTTKLSFSQAQVKSILNWHSITINDEKLL